MFSDKPPKKGKELTALKARMAALAAEREGEAGSQEAEPTKSPVVAQTETWSRAFNHFVPLEIWYERGKAVSAGRQIPNPARIAASLATLIEILESRGVLTGEDVDRILEQE